MTQKQTGMIAFASGKTSDYDIWTFDLADGELRQITSGTFWNDKPRWSPDGQWIVFTSNRTGYQEIFKVPATGGEAIQLTELNRWADSPTFSPDGSLIAFISNEAGNNDIWVMDADGQGRRQLTNYEGTDDHVDWTPDGQGLLWSSDRGNGDADIWHLDLVSDQKTQLNEDLGLDISPACSPNGKLVAFVSNRQMDADPNRPFDDRDKDIWLMGMDGEHAVRLTKSQGADFCPSWSPDGTQLLYVASKDNTACHLRVMDISTVIAAFTADDKRAIEKAAKAVRDEPIQLDRDPLKDEIDARRHTTFLTSFLPDKWLESCYPHAYFGLERHPHWVAATTSTTSSRNPSQTATANR